MGEDLEIKIGRLEGTTEYIAHKLDDISEKLDKDHDLMINCSNKINGHLNGHAKEESTFKWKVGIAIGLISIVVSLVVSLITQ